MDPRVEYVDEIEPVTDTQLERVRGVYGVDWAVPFHKGLTVAHARDGLLQQVILLGVDDATLAGVVPHLVLGAVENPKRPDGMIIDRAGFQHMWPGAPLALEQSRGVPQILMRVVIHPTRYWISAKGQNERRNGMVDFGFAGSRPDARPLHIHGRTPYFLMTW
jgi:hypothetical protein